jgi:hypothetical protein
MKSELQQISFNAKTREYHLFIGVSGNQSKVKIMADEANSIINSVELGTNGQYSIENHEDITYWIFSNK